MAVDQTRGDDAKHDITTSQGALTSGGALTATTVTVGRTNDAPTRTAQAGVTQTGSGVSRSNDLLSNTQSHARDDATPFVGEC